MPSSVFCNDGFVLFVMILAVVWFMSLLPLMLVDHKRQSSYYKQLTERVRFAPPDIVYSIVWSILNVLVSIALYVVLEQNDRCFDSSNSAAVGVFFSLQFVQMFYVPIMFGWRWKFVGLLNVFTCLVLAAVATWLFWRISTAGGVLMLFIDAWLLFAFFISAAIIVFPSQKALQEDMNRLTGHGGRSPNSNTLPLVQGRVRTQ